MVAKKLEDNDRKELLRALERMDPDADASPENIARVFLPLPEHRRVLDDRVVLVLGDRGMGKSALFHFLQTDARTQVEPHDRPHEWVVGFSEQGIEHPAPLTLEQLVTDPASAEQDARSFWLGHLIGRIASSLEKDVPKLQAWDRWSSAPTDPKLWIDAFRDPTSVVLWLDSIEQHLTRKGRVLVVTYDHLDRIGVRNREARRRLLPQLLALWLSFSNRYRALRAKIFLRQDLFREAIPQTSDVSKLQARAETIRWTPSALFRLLFRHMAAGGEELREWLRSGVNKIALSEDPKLGWLPPETVAETGPGSQQAFMDHLLGKTMGETNDPRAGYPHKWVPARLADANGAIAPRSMVTLFRAAAKHALTEGPKAHFLRLLTPAEMKQGLRETSQRRVSELVEEHPVVGRLALLRQQKLPLHTGQATKILGQLPDAEDGFGLSGELVLEELSKLGVVLHAGKDRARQERIDIPDIYRLHFQVDRIGQKVTS